MNPDFSKFSDGLIPAIVQDVVTNRVLMLGYMNEAAFTKTSEEKKVTFYSRRKQRLWTKGETSGNYLEVIKILIDCDADTLLIKAKPLGPVCHTGADTCFNETNSSFSLELLETIIESRKHEQSSSSYTSLLFADGLNRITQKVGEEATELVIESIGGNDESFLNEAADLLFHYLVLLHAKNFSSGDVVEVLAKRHKKR